MLGLREKIGQMFMVGIQGQALNRDERSIIEACGFGGFILFRHNCGELAQILSLCRSLWATGTEHPPFIAIDQEGGRVHRLGPPFSHFPAAALIGKKADLSLAYRAGRAAAEELTLAGFNLNFAPVLDVNSNPKNPIIGDRSFAADPATVIKLSKKWLQGSRDGGIIPCGKHFPGHGDTDKDSHLDLPSVDRPLEDLQAVELPPFIHACRIQIESLMTAHAIYRALDPRYPATLSSEIVTGLLRQQLGYDGVVFSDDLEMKAVSDTYGGEDAAALCVRAGVDVLLYGHDLIKAVNAFEFLCGEAEADPAVRAQVDKSYGRITKLKRQSLKQFVGVSATELVERLAQLDHQRLISEIQGNL